MESTEPGMMADIEVVGSDHAQVAFDAAIAPAVTVEPGAVVRFEVENLALERLAAGETVESIGFENLNVVTGPVAIAGAEPGDTVQIDVLDIEIASARTVRTSDIGTSAAR